ncbi:hypothetical protein PIB30_045112 [Stylosanthes scabra]|uniref:Uncharacterized protein n=1 Tax=Stylosanthes scabra TaxID=79078 RepID=A0ABU6QG15_9FABA|nr:hypothetical protein [Stylosanthes scabra]
MANRLAHKRLNIILISRSFEEVEIVVADIQAQNRHNFISVSKFFRFVASLPVSSPSSSLFSAFASSHHRTTLPCLTLTPPSLPGSNLTRSHTPPFPTTRRQVN